MVLVMVGFKGGKGREDTCVWGGGLLVLSATGLLCTTCSKRRKRKEPERKWCLVVGYTLRDEYNLLFQQHGHGMASMHRFSR